MGRLPLVFLAYTPWQLEVNYIRRSVLHHPFPFSSHPLSSPIPVSTSLTPTIPVYLTLGHVIFSDLRTEWSSEMGVERSSNSKSGAGGSSNLGVGWNLEQWKCEMGCPLTHGPCPNQRQGHHDYPCLSQRPGPLTYHRLNKRQDLPPHPRKSTSGVTLPWMMSMTGSQRRLATKL